MDDTAIIAALANGLEIQPPKGGERSVAPGFQPGVRANP
jgi:hypothetical protein